MANQKPVAEVRIGRVKATIWPNGTGEQPRHNVTFSRLYKDDAGEWKSTQSFGRNDLLVLEGKTVLLQKDRTGDTVDRYGR